MPYVSTYNPIEIVWARAKGYVARHSRGDATIDSVKTLLRDGLYGLTDRGYAPGVTASFAATVFDHTTAQCNRWLRESPRLCALMPPSERSVEFVTPELLKRYGTVASAHRLIRRKRRHGTAAATASTASSAAGTEESDSSDDDSADAPDLPTDLAVLA